MAKLRHTVVEAATVVCLRHNAQGSPGLLDLSSLGLPPRCWLDRLPVKIPFRGKWEVLMGQSECVNWLRSTAREEVVMRYAGEFKFAGGGRDEGESLEVTAIRELREEFALMHLRPSDIKLHPFNVKTTKPIKGRSYVMHNFVAMTSENPWLKDTELVPASNERLRKRRARFAEQLRSGEFWALCRKHTTVAASTTVCRSFAIVFSYMASIGTQEEEMTDI